MIKLKQTLQAKYVSYILPLRKNHVCSKVSLSQTLPMHTVTIQGTDRNSTKHAIENSIQILSKSRNEIKVNKHLNARARIALYKRIYKRPSNRRHGAICTEMIIHNQAQSNVHPMTQPFSLFHVPACIQLFDPRHAARIYNISPFRRAFAPQLN